MKQKIAFVIHGLGGGGAERVTSILCNRLSSNGYDVHVICNIKSKNDYPISDGVTQHIIGNNTSKNRFFSATQRFLRLRKTFRKERFDVIIGMMKMGEISVLANIGLGYPVIISVRNDPSHLYPTSIKRIYAKTVFSLASGAVFQTNEVLKWFPARLQKKAVIILNPISEKFYNVERVPKQGLMIATGRLHKQKNYRLMIDAVNQVSQKKDVILEIYGKGGEENKLKEYVKEIGAENYVKFCGRCDDIPSVLRYADLFLLSSDYEGLPNGLMEAMAIGLPCVSTDCSGGGARQLLGNNERGLLTPVGDEDKFARAIIKLLDDAEISNRLGKSAKTYAQRFKEDNCFRDWENYIISRTNK